MTTNLDLDPVLTTTRLAKALKDSRPERTLAREVVAKALAARAPDYLSWDQLSPGQRASYGFDADRVLDALASAGVTLS